MIVTYEQRLRGEPVELPKDQLSALRDALVSTEVVRAYLQKVRVTPVEVPDDLASPGDDLDARRALGAYMREVMETRDDLESHEQVQVELELDPPDAGPYYDRTGQVFEHLLTALGDRFGDFRFTFPGAAALPLLREAVLIYERGATA